MAKVFSALSNPGGDLQSLQYEFTDLINFFNDREIKKKADFGYALNAPLNDITATLLKEQKDITLFHFSGHSGQSGLDLEGEDFESAHIADFFNALSAGKALQCVFLNGCENEAIVSRLKNVPVIIGTKSKIQDRTARKFTLDFFHALIGGENTYEQAFKLAKESGNISDAEISITRGESGRAPGAADKPVDPYFLQINDGNTGKTRFAFKPKQANWTKYLVLLLLAVALSLGWLYRVELMTLIKGYDCTKLTPKANIKPEQCVFAIGDINQPKNWISISALIYDRVKINPLLREYLYPINIDSFSKALGNSGRDRDSLPSLCHYDFNLTGNLVGDSIELLVFPYVSKTQPPGRFPYKVESVDVLGMLLSAVDSVNATPFVLFTMCYSCGMKKENKGITKAMSYLADQYDPTHSTETYQRLNYDLSALQLEYRDTTAALASLDKIRMAVGNDFSLMATERKTELLLRRGDIKEAYEAQTALLYALSDRVMDSTQFKLSTSVRQYDLAAQKARLARANMVLEHRDGLLKDYREEALEDFNRLQDMKTPPGDFTREIKILKGQPTETEPAKPPAPVKKSVTVQAVGMDESTYQGLIKFFKSSGYTITAASANYDKAPDRFTEVPEINYHSPATRKAAYEFSGRLKARTKTAFQVNYVPISTSNPDPAGLHNIQIRWIPTKDEPKDPAQAMIHIRGQLVTERGLPVDSATISFADKKTMSDAKGSFDLGLYEYAKISDIPIYIQHHLYDDRVVGLSDFTPDQKITLYPKALPSTPVVVLRAYQVGKTGYEKLIDGLRHKGYIVDLQRCMYSDTAPENSSLGSTIIYRNPALEKEAYRLSKQMKESFHMEFDVRYENPLTKLKANTSLDNTLWIHWVVSLK